MPCPLPWQPHHPSRADFTSPCAGTASVPWLVLRVRPCQAAPPNAVLDAKLCIVSASADFAQMLGYTARSLEGMGLAGERWSLRARAVHGGMLSRGASVTTRASLPATPAAHNSPACRHRAALLRATLARADILPPPWSLLHAGWMRAGVQPKPPPLSCRSGISVPLVTRSNTQVPVQATISTKTDADGVTHHVVQVRLAAADACHGSQQCMR